MGCTFTRSKYVSRLLIVFLFAFPFCINSCGPPGKDIPQPTYSWLSKNIFESKCTSCHTTGNAAYGVDLSSYSQIIATGSVLTGSPFASSMYTTTRDGTMPKSGSVLSDEEVQAIYDWINSGAVDDTAAPASPPAVISVNPTSGPKNGGTKITITGTNFVSGASVTVGGSPCTSVQFISSTSLACTTPAGTPGAVDIIVTNPDTQTGTLLSGFTYNNVILVSPTVTSVLPASGSSLGGTSITITGTNFVAGATVSLGGSSCGSVIVNSATQITCTTSAHLAAVVNVVVTNSNGQSGTLVNGYAYTITATFASINQNILQPKCVSCHSGNGAPRGVKYSSYALTLSTGSVIAGNAAGSSFYTEVNSGSMPKNGTALTPTEKQAIYDWIQNGAQNN